MKSILITALCFVSLSCFADSFTVIKNGQEYLCQSTGTGSNPNPNPGQAAACAEKAYAGPFSRDESMQLCLGAISTGPADCAIKAYAGPFSKSEALQLCTRTGTLANADCAISAYQGPYSKEEAIRLCKSNPELLLRSLRLLENTVEAQQLKP